VGQSGGGAVAGLFIGGRGMSMIPIVIAGWNGRAWLEMGSICGLIDAIWCMFFFG